MKSLLVMAGAIMLQGCASLVKEYEIPTQGPASTLVFKAGEAVPRTFLYTFLGNECEERRLIGEVASVRVAPLAPEVTEKSKTLATTIRAGREIRVAATMNLVGKSCQITAGFHPEDGQSYEAAVGYDPLLARCSLRILRLTVQDKIPEKTASRPRTQCLW